VCKMSYILFETPDEVKQQILQVLKNIVSSGGKVKVGVNEVTKAIDRGVAKLVILAEDVSPPEIVAHIPELAKKNKVPIAYVSSKEELGKAAGKQVAASSVAIVDPGSFKEELEDLIKKLPKVE